MDWGLAANARVNDWYFEIEESLDVDNLYVFLIEFKSMTFRISVTESHGFKKFLTFLNEREGVFTFQKSFYEIRISKEDFSFSLICREGKSSGEQLQVCFANGELTDFKKGITLLYEDFTSS